MSGQRWLPRRRDWLRSVIVAASLGRWSRGAAGDDAIERVQAKARDARMQPFESTESKHFHGIGDAPARYRREALDLCEAFAADYFEHFRAKGFTIDWPSTKLPVVVLASPTSYAAFERGFVDEAVGGHFDLEANWLVTFDFRSLTNGPRPPGAADPRLDNTLALVHETFHQLSYNTGMLDPKADVPLCLAEGLATYAETWRPGRRGTIGATNARRRRGLELAQRSGSPWIAVSTLLANDAALNEAKSQQVAYAVSSLLVARLLKDPARLVQFHAYLKAVRGANDPGRRVVLATTHFGDLAQLDREIRR